MGVVGNEGRYQVIMLVYMCLCYFFAVYFWTSPSYLFMNPKFTCNGEDTSEPAINSSTAQYVTASPFRE